MKSMNVLVVSFYLEWLLMKRVFSCKGSHEKFRKHVTMFSQSGRGEVHNSVF